MNKQRIKMKSSEFQPKNEYVLVKPFELDDEETSESGLIISTKLNRSSMVRPTSGTVLSVGSDITDIVSDDFIVWPETDGLDITLDDGDFVILRYKSIIGMKAK